MVGLGIKAWRDLGGNPAPLGSTLGWLLRRDLGIGGRAERTWFRVWLPALLALTKPLPVMPPLVTGRGT